MKVNAAGGFFYGYTSFDLGTSKTTGTAPTAGRIKNDQVTLSKQVVAAVQMHNRIQAIEQARKNAENSPEAQALESMRKAMEIMKVCNKIASRIRAGDRVPLKDLRYLLKNDPRAYQMAMAARKPKEKPKEWKSAVPKEEQENQRPTEYPTEQIDAVQSLSGCESSSGTSSESGSSGTAPGGGTAGGI